MIFSAILLLPKARNFLERYMEKKHNQAVELLLKKKTIEHEVLIKDIYDKQHFLIHIARDLAVKNMPIVPAYNEVLSLPNPPGVTPIERRADIELVVSKMLQRLIDIFQDITDGDANIWACIRTRREDDHYHTWIRVGTFNPNRIETSSPMHKDKSNTMNSLKSHFQIERKCVMITGQNNSTWEGQQNDRFREDMSTLVGAVMTRSWDSKEDWINNCLSWVIFVNSDKENYFNESHIPTMQACVDVFSWLANSVLRVQHQAKI